jgi:ABC-type transporter Mla MlaB component
MGQHEMITGQDGSARLCLSGNFGRGEALALREAFMALLDQPERLELSLRKVEGLDITFLQLLFSLARGAKESGKQFVLVDELPQDPLAQAMMLGVTASDLKSLG